MTSSFPSTLRRLCPLALAALALSVQLLLGPGCANTSTPPSGGKKDTIPPVVVRTSPLPGAVNVPFHKPGKISVSFNEYVKLKQGASVFLSPPQEKKPKAVVNGKRLDVTPEGDLEPGRTYTLDLTDVIVDNNEGNLFPGYTLVFSTGPTVDSMCVSGIVQDASTLLPVKGATVMLYTDHTDSAVFLKRPTAAVKTDEWGFFALRNIPDSTFRVYAVMDANGNNRYDADGTESIAFLDSLFHPKTVFSDTLYEYLKFDMKDTLHCLARKTELELTMFREVPSRQLIVNKVRSGMRSAYLTFMAPDAMVYDLRMQGLPRNKLIYQFNPERDSLELWVNDQSRRVPDTLHLSIEYEKTDSTGARKPVEELVHFPLTPEMRAERNKSRFNVDKKHEDTVATFTLKVEAERVEQYGYEVEFKFPLIEEAWDALEFTSVNPRQQRSPAKFTVQRDTANLRRFHVLSAAPLQKGFDYHLKVPHRRFRDINGFWNDSSEVKVTLPDADELSSIQLNLSQSGGKNYIIDLLDEKRKNILRSFTIKQDASCLFPYLKKGNYCIRITEDTNGNNRVDTGCLLERRQPEKVRFFKTGETFLIQVLEHAEMVWDIDLEQLFS